MKSVLRLLSNDQKKHHVAMFSEVKEQSENYPNFIATFTTGDECWVYGSSQWKMLNSLRPKEARHIRTNVKSMLICFFVVVFLFDTEGIVHKQFVPLGETVVTNLYCDVLR